LDSYLQARRIFVPAQISKVFATLMAAVFALLFAKTWGIGSVASGFVVGTILGTILQFIYLIRSGYRWTPTIKVDKVFRTAFLALIVPSLLNALVGQLNMFIDKTFASGIGGGAVTYLNNASLIVSIPTAIYATTIAAIIFTMLSDQIDHKKKFQGTFFMGMEISFLTLLPIAAGLLIVGDLAISFIYERGKFTPNDTHHTYMALILYLPMIVAQGLQFIVSKSMYARGRTSTIFKISVTTILLNIILNYLFVRIFSYPGLALSSSIVAIYYLVVSAVVVYRDFDKSESLKLFTLVWRGIPPVIIMIVPLYFLRQVPLINHLYSLWQLVILIPLGVALYVISLRLIYREGFNRLLGLTKKRKHA
jgi:putative peptidoglycan lipid II flippase